ncbi:AAA family ATPase, partial [Paraburkholderia sp.]|uniref:ExeA family protein n=1 Tax=Paraburkholderia sp. TaxID=1926495 RepID=UPI00286F422D
IVEELDPARFETAFVAFPNLAPDDFLRELLRQFGYAPESWDRSALRRGLAAFLELARRRGLSTLVVVDEAQTVSDPGTWEEIRMLLNYQRDRRFALTLFLAGQPELRALLDAQPPLAPRVAVRAHLEALDPAETEAYFAHRVAAAGGAADLFTDAARHCLAEASGGIPRRLNHLADLALLAGFGEGAERVDEALARRVLREAASP